MQPGDEATVARLWHNAWWDGHGEIVPECLLRHRHLGSFVERAPDILGRASVAVQDGAVVGFVAWQGDELEDMFVAREARGGGVAALLMAHGETALRELGATRAWLYCCVGNERAHRFYTKSGWREVGREIDSIQTPEGDVDVAVHRFEKAL